MVKKDLLFVFFDGTCCLKDSESDSIGLEMSQLS